ncbi:MAG: hypothetical protein HXX10_07030 [Rhodoplanes sp.]|uniref:hypothetical protein n=1 Tax=Rhodoplanes sp. TaxID=1968906 RepID=UPI001847AB0A|nr:hypothetical protein [Rhodoplanes sp.]NVO13773.1 hypothetical protein [Rhodoplanes sp.]
MTPPPEAWGELAAILRMRNGRPLGAPATGSLSTSNVGGHVASEFEVDFGVEPATDAGVDDLLLCRRMRALRLDPDELYCNEPRAFSVLRKLCATCSVPARCARDLGDEFSDPGWQDWRNYCPNATTLSILSALRGCGPDEISAPAGG